MVTAQLQSGCGSDRMHQIWSSSRSSLEGMLGYEIKHLRSIDWMILMAGRSTCGVTILQIFFRQLSGLKYSYQILILNKGWNDEIVFLNKTTLRLYFKAFIEKINSGNFSM